MTKIRLIISMQIDFGITKKWLCSSEDFLTEQSNAFQSIQTWSNRDLLSVNIHEDRSYYSIQSTVKSSGTPEILRLFARK